MSAVRILEVPAKEEMQEETTHTSTEEAKTMASPSQYNKVPTFVWAILVTVIAAAGSIVAVQSRWQGSMEKEIENQQRLIQKLEERIQMQETYLQNLREKLAERGWNAPQTGRR